MKIYNPIASGKASGRAFGGVFSFNRGLATFKRYVIPRNLNTTQQKITKTRFSTLTKYWKENLTYEQILLWQNWDLPWTDIYGNAVILTGINKFFIINSTLHQAGKSLRLIPPTLTPPTLVIADNSSATEFHLDVTQPSTAEVAAQHPFLFIEINGVGTGVGYDYYEFDIMGEGIPISRVPLEKNYHFIGILNEEDTIQNPDGEAIIGTMPGENIVLYSVRVERFNDQGYWSNSVITTRTLEPA
jgi:hypothetical protein